jgi:hypothetical protein
MRKTQLHVWIAMMFCALAMAAQAVKAGGFQLPF